MGSSKEMQIKDREERWQKGEEEHVGGSGEKEVEDKDKMKRQHLVHDSEQCRQMSDDEDGGSNTKSCHTK